MTEQPVEWRFDAANSRPVRLLIYGWMGLIGGAVLLALGLVLFVAISAAAAGEFTILALVVLLLLVGGPFSLLYLLPAIQSGSFSPLSKFVLDTASEPTESLGERYARVFSWRGAIASIVLHAIAIPTFAVVDPRLLGGYVVLWFCLLVLASVYVTWGRIDPTEPSFEYRSGTVPLAAVKRVRRYGVRDVVVCWISYHGRTKSITTPSLVVMTPEAASAFEAVRATADGTPPEPRTRQPVATVVAVAMGLGLVAFAGWIWTSVAVDGVVEVYASVVLGLAGVFFVWVGYAYT